MENYLDAVNEKLQMTRARNASVGPLSQLWESFLLSSRVLDPVFHPLEWLLNLSEDFIMYCGTGCIAVQVVIARSAG